MQDEENIYDLKLHETIALDRWNDILRVPGGWIYKEWSGDADNPFVTTTFVPFNNEFKDV